MMRILITGISGFVGSRLAKYWADKEHEVYGLVRYRADNPSYKRLEELHILDKVKLVYGDVNDYYSILRVLSDIEPDVIFHLAAQSHVHLSFKYPQQTLETNTLGTLNILEALRVKDIDAIVHFAGSSEEYGLQIISEEHYREMLKKYGVVFPKPERIPELPIKETNPLRPQSPYAISKVAADYLMQLYYKAYGMKTIITRAFNHEGAGRGDLFVTAEIARQVIEVLHNRRSYIEIGNVNVFRDWSYVEDVVEGYSRAAFSQLYGQPINLGSGKAYSVLSLILMALKKTNIEVTRLRTLDDKLIVKDPTEEVTIDKFGIKWKGYKVDRMLLEGELKFELSNKGIYLETSREPIKIVFDPRRYRPADVPILLADITEARSRLRWEPRRGIDYALEELLDYYYTKIVR